jgi:hypothetical protein
VDRGAEEAGKKDVKTNAKAQTIEAQTGEKTLVS